MKQLISDSEKVFVVEGFRTDSVRRDGRGNLDQRPFTVETGIIP